ncbi:4577_t:CDS:2, partial [Dentiscutata heterogama]
MSSCDLTSVTYDSPSIASQYSSEKAEKDARLKHPGGRPPDPVWDHFFATPLKSSGYFAAKCKYCSTQFNRGCPNQLEIILQKNKININDYWKNENQILAGSKKEAVDRAIIKAFAMCGLPFSIIENPWFIDILKSLRSSYTLPTPEYLANILLNKEVIKVNWEIDEYLKTTNNLTL